MSHSANFQFLSIERAMEFIGDAQGVLSLLHTLRQSLNDDLPKIEQRLGADDVEGANQLLHQLKGFTPVFCTEPIVQEVVIVEALSKRASAQEVQQAYAQLAPKLAQLQTEVEQHIAANT